MMQVRARDDEAVHAYSVTVDFLTRFSARQWGMILAGVLVAVLAIKFFIPLLRFDVPMGYDAGIYRYLFARHATGFPPFALGEMQPWAYEHPLGLFFFSTILLKLGMPLDWLVGWIWNCMPVIVACALAWVFGRKQGIWMGVAVLFAAFLSQAFYDGFVSMYWKTFASLLFYVLAADALERKSWWAVLFGILTVVIHQQTGFLFGLATLGWFLTYTVRKASRRELMFGLGIGVAILGLGLLWYVPIWDHAVAPHLSKLLESKAGSFPPPAYYLRTTGILLALGAVGFGISLGKERGTIWQWSVIVCLAFVCLKLLFFQRFFLQLDFFLLPFAASAMLWLGRKAFAASDWYWSVAFIALIAAQIGLSVQAASTRQPSIDAPLFESVKRLQGHVPAGATVLSLENISAPFVLGWLPEAQVGGPGLFSLPNWPESDWQRFFNEEPVVRADFLRYLPQPLYLFASPLFRDYYGPISDAVLADPCLQATQNPDLLLFVCPNPPAQP